MDSILANTVKLEKTIKGVRTTKVPFKGHRGGPAHFFTKINLGFYLKALSANYKLVFIELKNIIYILRYFIFSKKFPIQMYGPEFFGVNFLGNLKNH